MKDLEQTRRTAAGIALSVSPHTPGTTGAAAYAAGEGDFKAEILLLKLTESAGRARETCCQVGCFYFLSLEGVLHVQKLEGGRGGSFNL